MRKTASRLITSGVMAAALTLGLIASAVAAAPAALASPACHGVSPSCVGHDPSVYGCSPSVKPVEEANSYGTVWLYFSNNCDAKWAAGQLTPESLKNGYSITVTIETTDNSELMCAPVTPRDTGRTPEFCTSNDGTSAIATTDMVNGHLQATADVNVWNGPKNHVVDVLQVTM